MRLNHAPNDHIDAICVTIRIQEYLISTLYSIEYRTVISGGTDVTSVAIRGRVLRPLEYYGTFSDDG
jgi:hypothetical protein